MRILLFTNLVKQGDEHFLRQLMDKLDEKGIEVGVMHAGLLDVLAMVRPGVEFTLVNNAEELSGFSPDFILSLGGDGTILKAATLACKPKIPLLGINLGRLGFLSSVEKSMATSAIDKLVEGSYIVEERSMLSVRSNHALFGDLPFALNDFTIHKRDTSSMISIHTYINGEYLNTYWADGLIVATPTGSTGYSLACGGPIIFPGSKSFVITPIAPHNLNVRPLVIRDDVEISFEIEGRAENFLCTMDSRFETISDDYKIAVQKSQHSTQLVLLEGMRYMATMREKLLWGLDRRN
ncbi:MAG: NAD kinase [Saprospiraceae bacterium]|nr:NAD kinase [Saprospiraceae bacterium]